jgi:SAM-dependent methyltransferase
MASLETCPLSEAFVKKEKANPAKELYRQIRVLTCDQLWDDEVTRFDRATPRERMERVAVVRAVGVVFSETGTEEHKEKARKWLRGLLRDPCEKIRRYAMAAMPKIGAGPGEEAELLGLLRATDGDREKKYLGQTLEKIAGTATLLEMEGGGFDLQTRQKVEANVARDQGPSDICMDGVLSDCTGLRIHLRGRGGLEGIVRDEVNESPATRGKFRVIGVRGGLVAITPLAPFSLADIHALRCFGTVAIVLGHATSETESIDAWASMITSPLARNIFKTFTRGSIRYRLNFAGKGHQRSAVRQVANQAYAMCPELLNDARSAPWTIAIHPARDGGFVEPSPNLASDPRLYFRLKDVPAASHPPLAACMARLAGKATDGIVWDPFCGSGLELIERALLGGVRRVCGTDSSADAVEIARDNFDAAKLASVRASFVCCDFRDFQQIEGLGPETVGLVITNPPMGRRVPIPNLRGLMEDLFSVAATVLKPGGKLVFANPVRMESSQRSLKLQSRRIVDLGGFNCRVEEYLKLDERHGRTRPRSLPKIPPRS